MSTTSTKTGNGALFRWESGNHGLDHKCGICHTVLSSPKAKNSCFGKHEEVCCRYHGTLFMIGQAHKCEPCRKTNELHIKRLRDIAIIEQQIRSLAAADASESTPPPTNPRKRSASKITPPSDSSSSTPDSDSAPPSPSSDLAPKRTRTSAGAVPTTTKKERKAAKSAAKHPRATIITSADVARLEALLHPSRPTPGTNALAHAAIEPNLALSKPARALKAPKRTTTRQQPDTNTSTSAVDEHRLAALLAALALPPASTKESKELLKALRAKLAEHMTVTANEDALTMQRMEGYWRYVNRKTYNCMVRNGELWDWETGERLGELEGEGEGGGEGSGEGEERG